MPLLRDNHDIRWNRRLCRCAVCCTNGLTLLLFAGTICYWNHRDPTRSTRVARPMTDFDNKGNLNQNTLSSNEKQSARTNMETGGVGPASDNVGDSRASTIYMVNRMIRTSFSQLTKADRAWYNAHHTVNGGDRFICSARDSAERKEYIKSKHNEKELIGKKVSDIRNVSSRKEPRKGCDPFDPAALPPKAEAVIGASIQVGAVVPPSSVHADQQYESDQGVPVNRNNKIEKQTQMDDEAIDENLRLDTEAIRELVRKIHKEKDRPLIDSDDEDEERVVDMTKNYRMYRSKIGYQVKVHGIKHHDTTDVFYRVGAHDSFKKCITSSTLNPRVTCKVSQWIRMPTKLLENFNAVSRKYVGFVTEVNTFDLCAVIEQLMVGVCIYAQCGELCCSDLAGGNDPRIVPLTAAVGNPNVNQNYIYMPAETGISNLPCAFNAILSASAGVGGTVVTDYVRVDPVTMRSEYQAYSGAALAYGCIEALRLIAAHYELCMAGDVFALACARGVARVMKVVAHTDEGGVFRAILRTGAYNKPHGALDFSLMRAGGIPKPASADVASWRCMVDSFALGIAAAVSDSDPGMAVGDKWVCTISSYTKNDDANGLAAPTVHSSRIAQCIGKFSPIYTRNLMQLFGVYGYSKLAAVMLDSMASANTLRYNRHLVTPAGSVIAPFYWIEPTTILPDIWVRQPGSCPDTGSIINTEYLSVVNPFRDYKIVYNTSFSYNMEYDYHSIRTNRFFTWLSTREGDGLGMYTLAGLDPGLLVAPGPDLDIDNLMRMEGDATESLGRIRWRYRDCPIPKPIEGLYLGDGMMLECTWYLEDRRYQRSMFNRSINTPIPSHAEIDNMVMKMNYMAPERYEVTTVGSVPNYVEQRYNNAIRSLNAAVHAVTYGTPVGTRIAYKYGDIHLSFKREKQDNIPMYVNNLDEKPSMHSQKHMDSQAYPGDIRSEKHNGVQIDPVYYGDANRVGRPNPAHINIPVGGGNAASNVVPPDVGGDQPGAGGQEGANA